MWLGGVALTLVGAGFVYLGVVVAPALAPAGPWGLFLEMHIFAVGGLIISTGVITMGGALFIIREGILSE